MPPPRAEDDTKQRANRCMIKLADRDTESMAATELDVMARTLPSESLPLFISAISDTRPSDKAPLRRHSLRLISVLSLSRPPSSLIPLIPRLLSAALRRLRDADSSVRSALVDAVRSLATSNPSSIPSLLLPPLSHALLHEQDIHAQIAAALALSAAVDASDHDNLAPHLHRLLPRLLKLLKSNAYKPKPALISLIGAVSAAGGAGTPNLVAMLVPSLAEFLASDDWAARKAAAEALSQVGVSDPHLLGGLKSSCFSSFESRRFDKVKIVRDSMNRMLEVWKDIPAVTDDGGGGAGAGAGDSSDALIAAKPAVQFTARKSRASISRSPPPIASPISATKKKIASRAERKSHPHPLSSRNAMSNENSDWKVDITVSESPKFEEKPVRTKEGNLRAKLEARKPLFESNSDERASKLGGGPKSASRVVRFEESGSTGVINDSANDVPIGEQKDSDLCLIRRQLIQIENQQSSLLELLQRFIGSSQNGIHSLESRVHGLEMVIDQISRDLVVSSGRLSHNDPAVKTCCSIPGAEFLSPKFWRRTEGGRYSLSTSSTLAGARFLAEQQGAEYYKNRGAAQKNNFVVNPLAEVNPLSRGNTEAVPNRMLRSINTGIKH